MRILIMGGTRFIGVYLTKILVDQGHEVVLFNRGNNPAPVAGISQIHGDRKDAAQLKEKLAGESFDAIFDNNGRELSDTQPLVEIFNGKVQHFVYVSSAGVYLKTPQMPHVEGDTVDPKSRHKGKHHTEAYLTEEAWFFDRLVRDRPIPIPGNGQYITQLGHIQDLAVAMARVLGNKTAIGKIYNISGDRYVTFDGLAYACASAVGKSPEDIKLVHYEPSKFDFGKKKAFPMRQQHFFADIHQAKTDLDWQPNYDLVSGLKDSFQNDYLASGRDHSEIDFALDEEILGKI